MKANSCKSWWGALCALLILSAPAAAQPTKLTVGYGAVSADQLVLWVAKDTGIFAKNNLDVQIVFFSGGTMSVMAMVSGDTPIIQASGPAVVAAGLGGSEGVVVAGGIVTLDYQLITQPNIKTIEQLKGGSVAIARFGGAADFVVRFALSKFGLNPQKDVTIVQVGTTPERLAALVGKRVQGTVLVPPTTFEAQKGGFYLLADIGELGLAYQHQGAVTTKKFIRERPDVVRNFVKSYIDSVHFMKTERQAGLKILAKHYRVDDKDILERTYDNSITDSKLPRKQYPTLEGIKTILDQLGQKDPKAKAAKPQDFVDTRFVEEFDKSGYVDSLYGRAKR
jgi:NitT/TauT family transport system substrate-binding protein